ncbi:hypothetical protein L208DRAFT_1383330 [Tricholoma matsutake]|nr:hypothetical protein L208DRAFT_1383330 [Tricholoma matsutake 945]
MVILPSPLLPVPSHEQLPTVMVGGAAAMMIPLLSSPSLAILSPVLFALVVVLIIGALPVIPIASSSI